MGHRARPFVGRERELARLCNAFEATCKGETRIAAVAGEPGIGKTRLAEELERYARERGALVLWGRVRETAGAPPYWPWIKLGRTLGDALGPKGLSALLGADAVELQRLFPELRELLPDLPPPEPALDAESARFRLFEALTGTFRRLSQQQPVVLVLDDLHWADAATLLLLQHLAAEVAGSCLMLVVTYRDGEVDREHPFSGALAELTRLPGFDLLTLRGLSHQETAEYVRQTSEVAPAAEVERRIYEATEGNPFFTRELVHLLAEGEVLAGGRPGTIPLPAGIRAVLGRHIERLSPEALELLRTAAIVGREFTHETLALLVEGTGIALVPLLEEALRSRVIEEAEEPGRYRFVHALMQEALLADIAAPRRALLHAQVAEALERRWGNRAGEYASRLASHFAEAALLGSEHAEKAFHYSRLAAEQAEAQLAWPEAARHYGRAAEYVESGSVPGDADALRARQGQNELRDLDFAEGERRVLAAIRSYMEREEDRSAGRIAAELELKYWNEQHHAIWRSLARRLESTEPHLAAALWAYPAQDGWDEDAQAARARARELLDEHRISAPDIEDWLLLGLLARPGVPTEEFNSTIARFRELLRSTRSTYLRLFDCFAMTTTQWNDLDWLRDDARKRLQDLRREGRFFTEPITLSQVAATHLLRAEFDAFERVTSERMHRSRRIVRWIRGQSLALRGDPEAALALYPDPPGAEAPPPERHNHFGYAMCRGSRTRMLFWLGRHEEALSELERWEQEWDRLRYGIATMHRLTSFAAVDDVLPALGSDALVERVYAEVSQHVWRDLRLAATDGIAIDPVRGKLALRLGRVDEAEDWFRTGRDWAEQQRCPVELGRNLQGLAEVAERRGKQAEALEYLNRAGELFRKHDAKLYLDQVHVKLATLPTDPYRYPDGLSPREVEVLRLVAAGKSNREIAEALVISRNTVDRHLNHIYSKAGLANRAEAASYAHRRGLVG